MYTDKDFRVVSQVVMWNDAAVSRYGERLVQLRTARGLGPYEAARAIGITHETLQDAERGTRLPRQKTRQKLAAFYGVHPDTLEPVLRYAGGLQTDLSLGRVAESSASEQNDSTHGEDEDMTSEDKARRAQQLLMGLPVDLRARAVALILELNHRASLADMAELGKGHRHKEGSG